MHRQNSWTTQVVAGLIVLLGLHAQDARAGAKKVYTPPPEASLLKQNLVLKSKESSKTEDLVAEYIPASETLDHWTLMLGVRIFSVKVTPAQAAEMKEQEIAARQDQGDVMARSTSFAKGDTTIVDFVMSQRPIVEHNVIAFKKLPDGRLASYQLARRYYQDPSGEVDDGLRGVHGRDQDEARRLRGGGRPGVGGISKIATAARVGHGVAKDPTRALELYQKACVEGDTDACRHPGLVTYQK